MYDGSLYTVISVSCFSSGLIRRSRWKTFTFELRLYRHKYIIECLPSLLLYGVTSDILKH